MPQNSFHDFQVRAAIDKDTGPVQLIEKAFPIFAERLGLTKVENWQDVQNFRFRHFKKFTYDEIYFVAFVGKNSIELSITKQFGWSRDRDIKIVIRYGKKTDEQIANIIFESFQKLHLKITEQPWCLGETAGTKWANKNDCPICKGRVIFSGFPSRYTCNKCG